MLQRNYLKKLRKKTLRDDQFTEESPIEAYLEACQTSMIVFFAKIVIGF